MQINIFPRYQNLNASDMELTILQQRMLLHSINHLLAHKLPGIYYKPCLKLGLCLLLGTPGGRRDLTLFSRKLRLGLEFLHFALLKGK